MAKHEQSEGGLKVRKLIQIAVDECRPDPNQPRKHFDDTGLRSLGESMKVRQNEPIQLTKERLIIEGERRWRAAKLVGKTHLDAIITDLALSSSEVEVIRLGTFFHRQGLSSPEQTDAIAGLLQINSTWGNSDVARHLSIDPASVTRLLAPLKCIPPVLEAYRAGKLGVSEAYEFFKLNADDQAALLAERLAGGVKGREAIKARVRKARGENTEGVKRLRLELESGVTVQFALDAGLCLESALAAALEASKVIKRGMNDHMSASTLAKACAERAKAGGS